ncbi:MAG: outer membrane beta-barrel protein [Desulfobacterales bacterium]
MNTNRLRFILILLLVHLSSAPLFAAQFNFTPSLLVSEEYTDNVFRDAEDEEDDFITSVGVSLAGEVQWQTAGLTFNYTPTYQFYADNSELDDWRHGLNFLAYKEYKRNTRFEFRNAYLYTQDPGDSTDDEDRRRGVPSSIQSDRDRRGRETYYTNESLARVTHRFGEDDLVDGGLRYRLLRDVDLPQGVEESDSDIWEPFLGLDYWFDVRWGVQLDGLYSNRDYTDRDDREEYTGTARLRRRFTRHFNGFIEYRHTYLDFAEEVGNESDYTVYAPSVGIQYQWEENANIRFGVGYYQQEFDDSNEDDENGVFLNADIFKTWPYRRGYVTLVGGSGYDVDDEGVDDNGFRLYYSAGLSAGYDFTRRLSGNVFSRYTYNDYPDAEEDDSDQTINAGAGLRYQALRWMDLGLQYSFAKLISDDSTDEYTENSVMFTVRVFPIHPFQLNR